MILDRGCYERGCACLDDRVDKDHIDIDTPLDVLTKLRKNYQRHGKTLHAHIIHNAMEQIKKHGRKQKTTEEVQTEADTPGQLDVRAYGYTTADSGCEAASSDCAPRSDGQAGAR